MKLMLNSLWTMTRRARAGIRRNARRRVGCVETLEGRRLLSVTEVPLPTDSSSHSIATGADGDIWFTLDADDKIGRLDPATGGVTEYPVPDPLSPGDTIGDTPAGILAGPDGNLYFMFYGHGAPGARFANSDEFIDRINPQTGAISSLALPKPIINASLGSHDAVGPNGDLYFSAGNLILQLNPWSGAMKTIKLPDQRAIDPSLAFGANNELYVTYGEAAAGTYYFGRYNLNTRAFKRQFVPNKHDPTGTMVEGPDGNIYFLQYGDRLATHLTQVDEYNSSTRAFTEYPVNFSGGSSQTEFDYGGIIVAPDGNIDFSDPFGEAIGELNLSTHAITETKMPAGVHQPDGLTIGPDHDVWFSEDGLDAGQIGRITLDNDSA